jgi:hypothetical protein
MKLARRNVCLGIAAFTTAACSAQRNIQQGQAFPIPANAQALPPERIEQLMIDAASRRGWQMSRRSPGQLVATLQRDANMVWTEVRVTATQYSFVLQPDLSSKSQEIQQNYPRWIYYLKSDIDARLAGARA